MFRCRRNVVVTFDFGSYANEDGKVLEVKKA